jgi:uncharacterized protein involved in exopolysaccharide biosynthesis
MDHRQFFVRDVLTVLFKHWKLIVFLPIFIVVGVFFLNYLWPPTYESSALVKLVRGREVSQADPTVTPTGQEFTMVNMSVEDLNSALEILKSEDLLDKVVAELDLVNDPNFPYGDNPVRKPYLAVRALINGVLNALHIRVDADPAERAKNQLRDALGAEPRRDSYVFEVTCRLGDPALAQVILNATLDEFRKLYIHVHSTSQQGTDILTRSAAEIKAELEKAEAELLAKRKETNAGAIDTELELLNEQYAKTQQLIQQLEKWSDALSDTSFYTDPVAILALETDSTVVREMQFRLSELMLEQNRVRQSLGENHPQVQSINAQVSIAYSDLTNAIAKTLEQAQQRSESVDQRMDTLSEFKSEIEAGQREVTVLSDAYERYRRNLQEAKLSKDLGDDGVSSVRIASQATLPSNPVTPNRLLNLGLAIVGGMVLALALAFFIEYLDHGLKTPEDVEYYVQVTPLASFFNKPGQALQKAEGERLATILDTVTPADAPRIYSVTSSVPNEGAAQVAHAISLGFAQDPENRTLLIDFTNQLQEARRNPAGLSDVLLDQASVGDITGGSDALVVIGRGSGDYPAHIWGSERMHTLVDELKGHFRYIVFHTGPVLASHDAIKLARHTSGVLLTIKSDATRREVVQRSVDMLRESNAQVLGAVLTERRQTIPRAVYRRFLRA